MPYKFNPLSGKLDYYAIVGEGEIDTIDLANDAVTNDKLGTDVKIGSIANLETSDKTSLVAALNEVQGISGGVSDQIFLFDKQSYYDTKKRGHIVTANIVTNYSGGPNQYYYEGTYRRFYFVFFEGRKNAEGNLRSGYENKSWISYFDLDTQRFGPQYTFTELWPDSDDVHNFPIIIVADDGHILVAKEDLDFTGAPAIHNSHIEIWRSDNPEDISSFTLITRIGDDTTEKAFGYPRIIKLTDGTLFIYVRDKISGEERYQSIVRSVNHGLTWTDLEGNSESRTIVLDYTTSSWFTYHRMVTAKKSQGINVIVNPRHSTSSQGYKAVHFLHSEDGITWINARQFVEGSGGYSYDVITSGYMNKTILDANFAVDLSIISTSDTGIFCNKGALDPDGIPYIVAFQYNPTNQVKINIATNIYVYYYDVETHDWIKKDIKAALARSNDQYSYMPFKYYSLDVIPYGSGKFDIIITTIIDYFDIIEGDTVVNSGTLKPGLYYRVVTTETSHFGSGVVINDVFLAGSAYTCDGSNTVIPVRGVVMLYRTIDYGETFQFISLDNKFTKLASQGNMSINYDYPDINKLFMLYAVSESLDGGSTLEFCNLAVYQSEKI